jgi:hypothetical protein
LKPPIKSDKKPIIGKKEQLKIGVIKPVQSNSLRQSYHKPLPETSLVKQSLTVRKTSTNQSVNNSDIPKTEKLADQVSSQSKVNLNQSHIEEVISDMQSSNLNDTTIKESIKNEKSPKKDISAEVEYEEDFE